MENKESNSFSVNSVPLNKSEIQNKIEKIKSYIKFKSGTVAFSLWILGVAFIVLALNFFNSLNEVAFIFGILFGILGILIVCVSFPLYLSINQKENEKVYDELTFLYESLKKAI